MILFSMMARLEPTSSQFNLSCFQTVLERIMGVILKEE